MYYVIRMTVPTTYLVDSCAGGTWSLRERDALWFPSHDAAVSEVLSADLEKLSELESTWDVIPAIPPGDDPGDG